MPDDYVILAGAAVIVATAVILANLMWRYRNLVIQADESTRLAKDLWESVNSRFSVVDGRIIDLMAKTEVLSVRLHQPEAAPLARAPPTVPMRPSVEGRPSPGPEASKAAQAVTSLGEGTETEARVLRLLAEGPKSSAQIKEQIGRSREHTARLMKGFFDRGLVVRNDRNKPYVYEITEKGRSHMAS